MDQKQDTYHLLLFGLVFLVIAVSASVTFFLNNQKSTQYQPEAVSDEFRQAVQMAKEQYQIKKKAGVDFRMAQCLDNNLMPNWSAAIVHNPKVKSDNLAENQCSNFLGGRAKHLVELDLDGTVVKVQ